MSPLTIVGWARRGPGQIQSRCERGNVRCRYLPSIVRNIQSRLAWRAPGVTDTQSKQQFTVSIEIQVVVASSTAEIDPAVSVAPEKGERIVDRGTVANILKLLNAFGRGFGHNHPIRRIHREHPADVKTRTDPPSCSIARNAEHEAREHDCRNQTDLTVEAQTTHRCSIQGRHREKSHSVRSRLAPSQWRCCCWDRGLQHMELSFGRSSKPCA